MSNNSHILVGVGSIVNPQNVKQNMNVDDIAKELMKNGLIGTTATMSEEDPAEKFNTELAMVSRKLGIDLDDKKPPKDSARAYSAPPGISFGGTAGGTAAGTIGGMLGEAAESESNDSERESNSSGSDDSPASAPNPIRFQASMSDSRYENALPAGEFKEYTREQVRRRHIENVVHHGQSVGGALHQDNPPDYSFARVKEEQNKINMLGEIDILMEDLAEEGVDLSKIPQVGPDSSTPEIANVLRSLRYKESRARGGDLAEQMIMLMAKGAEKFCNGERSIAGYRPNLKGWSHTVAPKIRRLRNPAGELVHKVIEDSEMGPVGRLLLEIVPSAILYSATQSQQIREEGIYRDSDMG